ncbi:MAG TPA: FliI/YscN family ATPase [Burkholderiales bacterium]
MTPLLAAVRSADLVRRIGRISRSYGSVIESTGPDVFVGELCEIRPRTGSRRVYAEVVGLREGKVLMTPYEEPNGISLGSEVIATGASARVAVGDDLLGRVIDAFGKPLDSGPEPTPSARYPITPPPINPLHRARIRKILETGVRAIDTLLTIGRGQRVGIFSGSGIGKSSLLGMIARNMNADVNVIALVGERGREVREFIEEILGPEGRTRSVVVVATSDQPPLVRLRAALAATAIAEFFRDQGRDVVLTMDSITRFAMAQREIGLSIGEPPTARGYTPSVFAALPRLLERGGAHDAGGSITAFYTILLEGDDLNDPIGDAVRAILDGHVVLSRRLANQAHYPAVDVLHSVSRLLPQLATDEEVKTVRQAIKTLNVYQEAKDLIDVGAYRSGMNPAIDQAIRLMPALETFLKQEPNVHVSRAKAIDELRQELTVSAGRS